MLTITDVSKTWNPYQEQKGAKFEFQSYQGFHSDAKDELQRYVKEAKAWFILSKTKEAAKKKRFLV